jgi:hypothetical protein
MRSRLAKAVREEFGEIMERNFPEFERISVNDVVSSGNVLYRTRIGENLYGFIMLQFHRRRDAFTINVNISRDENSGTASADLTMAPEFPILRIHKLWGQEGDFWFNSPAEPSNPRESFQRQKEPVTDVEVAEFRKLVGDAIRLIGEYAIPYFGKDNTDTQTEMPKPN